MNRLDRSACFARFLRVVATAVLASSGALLSGCAHWAMDEAYVAPGSTPIPAAFEYDRARLEPQRLETREVTKHYTIQRLHLEPRVNVVDSHEIIVDYYDVHPQEPVPAILVLPISGGGNKVANFVARRFARRGYAAIIVHRQEGFKAVNELEKMNPTFQQIVLDHKQAIDWMQTRPELDPQHIGVFGVSAGGIKASLVSALDERIAASVLALSGGDVPYMFAYSKDRGLKKKRDAILEAHQVTADSLYETLSTEFIHDPLVHAHRIDARNTLMVLARYDAVVAYRKGLELREAIGNPETIVLPTGHYGAIVFLPWVEGRAFRFFEERFGRDM